MVDQSDTSLDHIAPGLRPLAEPIDAVRPDPENARTGHAVEETAESLQTYGQRKPVVANRLTGQIEAGEGTWKAARSLGWSHLAVVWVEDDPDTAAGYALADNRTAELSQWNQEQLKKTLARLPQNRPTGFDDRALAAILQDNRKGPPQTAENAPRPAAAEPSGAGSLAEGDQRPAEETAAAVYDVQPGDLWRLPGGDDRNHWLFCGDCRELDTWQRFLKAWGFPPVQGIFTSPPYAEQRAGSYGGVPAADYVDWFTAVQAAALEFLTPDGSLFLNIKPHSADGGRDLYVLDLVIAMARRWGWVWIDELAWNRQGFPGRYRNRFKNAHEPVYHFARTADCKFRPDNVSQDADLSYAAEYSAENNTTMGKSFDGRTGRNVKAADGRALPTNVITAYTGAHDPTAVTGHGATFPVQLPAFFLRAYSDPGDVWLDPFCGTGTLLVAAEQTKRIGLGIEVEPAICALALGRWARHMGREPEKVM